MRLSINKLSDITGQDRRRIKRIAEAALTPTVEGRAHLYESTELIPLLYDAPGYAQKLDLSQERALLAHYQAKKAEIELRTMEGEYVSLADVVDEVGKDVSNCRARLLAIPYKAAPMMMSLDNVSQAFHLLQDYIYEALAELSRDEKYAQQLGEQIRRAEDERESNQPGQLQRDRARLREHKPEVSKAADA